MKNVDIEKFVFDTLTVHQGECKNWNGYMLSDGEVYGREDDGTFVVFRGDVWNNGEHHFSVPCHLKTPDNPEWRLTVVNIGNWSGISVRQVINNGEHFPKYFSDTDSPDYEKVEATLEGFGLTPFDRLKVVEWVKFRYKYGDIPVLYPYYHRQLLSDGAVSSYGGIQCPEGGLVIGV